MDCSHLVILSSKSLQLRQYLVFCRYTCSHTQLWKKKKENSLSLSNCNSIDQTRFCNEEFDFWRAEFVCVTCSNSSASDSRHLTISNCLPLINTRTQHEHYKLYIDVKRPAIGCRSCSIYCIFSVHRTRALVNFCLFAVSRSSSFGRTVVELACIFSNTCGHERAKLLCRCKLPSTLCVPKVQRTFFSL